MHKGIFKLFWCVLQMPQNIYQECDNLCGLDKHQMEQDLLRWPARYRDWMHVEGMLINVETLNGRGRHIELLPFGKQVIDAICHRESLEAKPDNN